MHCTHGVYNAHEPSNMQYSWLEASLLFLEGRPPDARRAAEVQHPVAIKGAAIETGMTVNYR